MSKAKLLQDLQRLPLFSVTSRDYGQCRSFYMRWRKNEDEDRNYIVEFAEKKTFDKWGNSTNFLLELHYESGLYRDDIVAAHRWMERVCRSGLFDFNRYFGTIRCPRMKAIENP